MKTAIDFKNAAIRKEIKRWDIHNCSMCNYACGYVIDNDRVFYDSGCDCTYRGQNLSPRSFEDIADHYNMQSNETVIQRMNEFWGFSDNENNAENSNPNQLLENWEKDFENLAASLLLQGINIRHIVKFKLSFEEYVKNLLRQQEAKTREEVIRELKDFNQKPGEYASPFAQGGFEHLNAAIKFLEAQQQILDLNK